MGEPAESEGGPASWQKPVHLILSFLAVWQAGERPCIDAFLEAAPAGDHTELLYELIALEVDGRRRLGERPAPNEYQQRYPRLDPARVAGLFVPASGSDLLGEPARSAPATPSLPGYEVLAEMGRGGMGIVYRAFDRQRREEVALKVMQEFSAPGLYRFKQEFRALAGLSHPNLVALYDLVAEGGCWFFTMELVEGVNFLDHAWGGLGRRPEESTGYFEPAKVPERGPLTAAGLSRLREALPQLGQGLAALHAAGKLHRDVKPGNVLVTAGGRVVLLDFGLAIELGRSGWHGNAEREVAGTVPYMSPEQAAGHPLTPASDWYSVGVMLYEALTGRLPFSGAALRVLHDKQTLDAQPPSVWAADLPDDLARLCVALLARNPTQRPTGAEVLRRLGAAPDSGGWEPSGGPSAVPALVGRAGWGPCGRLWPRHARATPWSSPCTAPRASARAPWSSSSWPRRARPAG
jgi:serine/threonine protein kinase